MSARVSPTLVASPPTQRVRLPTGSRPLPGPDTLEHVLVCPIAQLIVAGRSGSALIHAYLDGHPEVLHIPHTFKFFDFVAARNLDQENAVTFSPVWEQLSAADLGNWIRDSGRPIRLGLQLHKLLWGDLPGR